jgi:hypothetical protein
VDEIPLSEVWELCEHWTYWPPEHLLLRKLAGYEPPAQPVKQKRIDPQAAKELVKFLGAPEKAPAELKDVVRWAEQMKQKMGANIGNA